VADGRGGGHARRRCAAPSAAGRLLQQRRHQSQPRRICTAPAARPSIHASARSGGGRSSFGPGGRLTSPPLGCPLAICTCRGPACL
jgi:hypothetical protein